MSRFRQYGSDLASFIIYIVTYLHLLFHVKHINLHRHLRLWLHTKTRTTPRQRLLANEPESTKQHK